MTTLNNIVDDILLTIRNGHISESENISRLQIEQWVHHYRALLIKQDIDKDEEIDESYIQDFPGVELTLVAESTNQYGQTRTCVLETVEDLPKLMVLNNRSSIVSVSDMYGNPIQVGDRTKSKFQKHRKYTCNDYIAYRNGDKLRVDGPNHIQFVDLQLVLEDPTDTLGDNECDYGELNYPMPIDKIPTLKELIFQKELGIRIRMGSDLTNDSNDDNARELPSLNYQGRNRAI